MPSRILSTLGWKASAAVAAIVLGAGVAGASTIVPTLISDDQTPSADTTIDSTTTTTVVDDTTTTVADDTTTTVVDDTTTTVVGDTTTTVVDDSTTSTTVADDSADDSADADSTDGSASADHPQHPDNFGAVVSEDARDGGVDGQEISDMAHARNEERRNGGTDESTDESTDDGSDGSTTTTTEATADASTSSGPGQSGAHRP